MAMLEAVVLVFTCVFLCFQAQSGFLDFEELSSINYGIDIIDKPVVVGQEPPGAIVLRSKYGQQYQCSYTDPVVEGERARQEQEEAIQTGIPELLRPLAEGRCLRYPKDWWTYELCYGRDVKQYHMEEGNSIVGKIIYLGYFESEFDWNNITEKDKLRKYHSHLYTNGTTCDLTNKPRQVEVRFECQDVDTDAIFEISEAQTCVYTLVVHTSRLCKHPYLRRASPAKPVPITCNPLVSPAQYEEYINTEQGDERTPVKMYKLTEDGSVTADPDPNSENLTGGQPNDLESRSLRDETSTAEAQIQPELPDPVPDDPTSAASKLIKEIMGKNTATGAVDNKFKVKIFTADELREILKPKVTESTPEDQGQAEDQQGQEEDASEPEDQLVEAEEEREPEYATVTYENMDDEVKVAEGSLEEPANNDPATLESFTQQGDVDDDEKIMAEFDKELNEIVDTAEKKAHMEMHRENIESAMQTKFSDIVDETEQELAQEGNPVKADRHKAFSDLAKTLTKLLSRLHRSEREKHAVEKHLRKAQLLAALNRAKIRASRSTHALLEKRAVEKRLKKAQLLAAVNRARIRASRNTRASLQKDEAEVFNDEANPQINKPLSAKDDNLIDKDKGPNQKGTELNQDGKEQNQAQKEENQQMKYQNQQMKYPNQQIKDQNQQFRDQYQQLNDQTQQTEDQIHQMKDQNQQIETQNQQIEDQTQPAEAASKYDEAQKDHSEDETEDADPDGTSLTQLHSLNNRVRVRVTRIKHAPPLGSSEASGEGKAVTTADGNKQTLQIPDDQRKELESTVKSELEKAGLETKGQKIEVKIITAGYFDTNREGVHVLSEEESSAFNNMIVSILGGNSQAAKEMTHQQRMEDAYSQVWGKDGKKQQKSTAPQTARPQAPPS